MSVRFCKTRHGNDFYREIRKLRKRYRTGYLTRKTKERLRETFQRLASDEVGSISAPLSKLLAKKASIVIVGGH